MLLQLAATLFLATAMSTAAQAPRLELRRVEITGQPATNPPRIAALPLTLINDGPRPVEVPAHPGIVPRIIGPDGKAVTLSDFRNLAGYAPPALPPDPEPPVRTGERREIESYHLFRTARGYQLSVPFGGAELAPGRYRIEVAVELGPVTRDAWIAAHAAAVSRPGPRPKDPRAAAERAAAKFEKHWAEVSSYFRGRLEAPPLELILP